MIYIRLFWEFVKIGMLSVGGGLATLPFLYNISEKTGWITGREIADMLAISESTPGAIGINMATYTGFTTTGIGGSILATVGLVTPAIFIIIAIARGLEKFRNNPYVESVFYCIRPASVALIAAAGLNVAKICFLNMEAYAASGRWTDMVVVEPLIYGVILFLFARKTKVHPIVMIGISAVVGILLQLG